MEAMEAKGLPVRAGFFPAVLDADECFDVIAFNDVLEHIPDVDATLEACARHLAPNGLVVVNAPNRGGFLYRTSKVLLQLGRPSAFKRLWQFGFPSPHVHYFDSTTIEKLAARRGLALVRTCRLPAVSLAGLYSRIRYAHNVSVVKGAAVAMALALVVPMLAILPPDIKVWIFKKNEE